MNLNDFFGKEFSVSTLTLLIAGALILLALIMLLIYTHTLSKKLKDATTPKFGFAGKPLYQFLVVLFLAGSIPLGLYAFQADIHFGQQAEEEVELKFQYNVTGESENFTTVNFAVIPYVDGIAWGDKEFDMFWSFEGIESQDVYEFNRTIDNPSNLIVKLKKGNYKIKVIVNYDNESEELIKEIDIN